MKKLGASYQGSSACPAKQLRAADAASGRNYKRPVVTAVNERRISAALTPGRMRPSSFKRLRQYTLASKSLGRMLAGPGAGFAFPQRFLKADPGGYLIDERLDCNLFLRNRDIPSETLVAMIFTTAFHGQSLTGGLSRPQL